MDFNPLGTGAKAQSHASRQWTVLHFQEPTQPDVTTGGSDLLRRGRRRRRSGFCLRNLCLGSRYRRHFLPSCIFQARLCLDGSLLCCPVLFSFGSIDPGAVGNEGPKLGRKLLYSPLSFSFGVRGVWHLALRLNNAGVGYGLFPFGHCFLPFIHCFLSLNQSFLAYI